MKSKKTGVETQRTAVKSLEERKMTRGITKRDIYSISQEKMKESLAYSNNQHFVHTDTRSQSLEESDFDYEEAGVGRKTTDSEDLKLMPRVSEVNRRIADRVARANDLDFLNYL